MRLTELFNTEIDAKGDWDEYDEDLHRYSVSFTSGDRDIDLDFEQIPRLGSHWEMGFQERKKNQPRTTAITGSGKEFDVFSKIISITKKFIKDQDIDSLSFTADKNDRNRYKLYQRIVDRFLPAGWSKEIHHSDDNRAFFTITKNNDDKTFG